MNNTNIEIKARCSKENQDKIISYLNNNNAEYLGIDNQTDTYFKVKKGRLKLRKGNIENSMIYYEREDKKSSKESKVIICKDNESLLDLENIVREIHDVLIEVTKKREIYFINNVKFHIDEVKDLGKFVEIEAISKNNAIPIEKIKEQCEYYKKIFNIKDKDLISESYSDMLLKNMEDKNEPLDRKTQTKIL